MQPTNQLVNFKFVMEVMQVGYTFKIRRNVFMYNHVLTVSSEQKNYEAIVESAPTREETMVIWLDDFGLSQNEVEIVREEMIKWFATQNIKCIFNEGKEDGVWFAGNIQERELCFFKRKMMVQSR